VLVVAAGLLVRTVRAVGALPLGFNPSRTLSVGLSGSSQDFARAGAVPSDLALVSRVRALPGVVAAGIGARPLGAGMGTVMRPAGEAGRQIEIGVDSVSPGYLEALGGSLVAGRFFDARDTAASPGVAILSARRHFWPGGIRSDNSSTPARSGSRSSALSATCAGQAERRPARPFTLRACRRRTSA
jgi:hypothetical protein